MNDFKQAVKPIQGTALIANVSQCYEAVVRTRDRNLLLPGLAVFYGPSGFGKSAAANYVANKTGAYYVQAKSTHTRKSFLAAVLHEMGINPAFTTSAMSDQIASELAKSGRPLIVDEFDHLVTASKVELIRDIYESSQGTILCIGEEQLPVKLERWERFHGRILNWVPAKPVSLEDAQLLCPIYAPRVNIDIDVLKQLVAVVRGSTRRVATNLEMLHEAALEQGIDSVSMNEFNTLLKNGFVSGETPRPRSF